MCSWLASAPSSLSFDAKNPDLILTVRQHNTRSSSGGMTYLMVSPLKCYKAGYLSLDRCQETS